MQFGEVPMLICLLDFSCLNSLLLGAEIFTVDDRLSNLFCTKFSSLDLEYIFRYEIVKTCCNDFYLLIYIF